MVLNRLTLQLKDKKNKTKKWLTESQTTAFDVCLKKRKEKKRKPQPTGKDTQSENERRGNVCSK